MSLENYALQIAQKYRVAISIAILKSKPNDVSIDQYLDQLRNTLTDKPDDDLNISACSDDFNIDSDELNIQNESSDQNDDPNRIIKNKHATDDQNGMNRNRISNHNGSTYVDDVMENNESGNDKTQDCTNRNDSEHIRKDKLRDLIKELGGNKDSINQLNQTRLPNQGSCEDVDLTQCYDEPQSTFDGTKVNSENNAHESQNLYNNCKNKRALSTTKDCPNNSQNYFQDKEPFNHKNKITNSNKRDVKSRTNKEVNEPRAKIAKKINSVEALKANVRKFATGINIDSNKEASIQATPSLNPEDPSLREINTYYPNSANNIKIVTNKPLNLGTGDNSLQTTSHSEQFRESNHTNILQNINTQQNCTQPDCTYNTHYSQSQIEDISIDSRYIHGNKNINTKTVDDNPNKDINDVTQHIEHTENDYRQAYETLTESNRHFSQDAQNMDSEIISIQANANKENYQTHITENNLAFPEAPNINTTNAYKIIYGNDSTATTFEALNFDTNKNTAIECIGFNKNAKTNYTEAKIAISDHAFSQDAQIMDINTFHIKVNNENSRSNAENDLVFSETQNVDTYKAYEKDSDLSLTNFNAINFDNEDGNNFNVTNKCLDFDINTKTNDENFTSKKTAISNEDCNNANQILDEANVSDEHEDINSQEERIHFKIIEELNVIKTYLSKNKECSNDTGYRSRTQSKSSDSFTQSSSIIDQAAICLFNYLVSCDLVFTSQDINDEISEVISKLIEKLHEEENYPSFIEQLLETVNTLLQHIYLGENYNDDIIVKKDEQIQRILLLTKSPHIQKYTIEKINSLLQNLLDDDTSDSVAEINNITKMENLCYILYLLQNILKKYANTSLSRGQNTQEDKVIRKNDISQLWRRKWIPNSNDCENAGSSENKCVLKECMAVLNKIIVKFMDGYSLVAYAALNCFNLMQA